MVEVGEFIATLFTDECDGCHKESKEGELIIGIDVDGNPFQLCEDCAKKLVKDLSHTLNLDKKPGEQTFIVANDMGGAYSHFRRVRAFSKEEAVEEYNAILKIDNGVCTNVLVNDVVDKDGHDYSQTELL